MSIFGFVSLTLRVPPVSAAVLKLTGSSAPRFAPLVRPGGQDGAPGDLFDWPRPRQDAGGRVRGRGVTRRGRTEQFDRRGTWVRPDQRVPRCPPRPSQPVERIGPGSHERERWRRDGRDEEGDQLRLVLGHRPTIVIGQHTFRCVDDQAIVPARDADPPIAEGPDEESGAHSSNTSRSSGVEGGDDGDGGDVSSPPERVFMSSVYAITFAWESLPCVGWVA